MNIFKKVDINQITNDYYDAYKENLESQNKKQSSYYLNTIIKIEFFTLIVGLIFMSYNHFFDDISIEIDTNKFASLFRNSQKSHIDEENLILLTQLEKVEVDSIFIKEEKQKKEEKKPNPSRKKDVKQLSKKLNINPTDINLLVEIIKSQVQKKSIESKKEDTIIISQL